MADFANIPAGIRSWLLLSLQLYTALQLDGGGTAGPPATNSTLRYNQIQAIGSHNSYHVAPSEPIVKLLTRSSTRALLGSAGASIPSVWQYTHASLATQLRNYGIRQVELDIYPDPQGGLFNTSAGLKLAGQDGNIGDRIPVLNRPGWKVMHVPDIDYNTTCWTFVECLQSIKAYSSRNRYHEPIAIYTEFKTDDLSDYVGPAGAQLAPVIISAASEPGPDTYVTVRNITQQDVTELHQEILSVFSPSEIITPDLLRGNATSLKAALTTDGGSGWPRVDDMRGKVLFVVINTYTRTYLQQFPGLRGALMFVSDVAPHSDDTVFLEPANENYTTTNQINAAAARVTRYAKAGYMVRVRSDYDTQEARLGSVERVRALSAAGAHFISTDFPSKPTFFNSSYQVRLPQAMICNPATTSTSIGSLADTLGTEASVGSATPSDATPTCS